MSNIKACIFDLDGTLTNTINAIAHFGNIALAAFGLPEIPVEDYKIYVGDGRDKLIHRMLGVYGKDNAEMFEKVRDVYDENYENDYLYDTDAYDGIRELLEELKENGIKIAVCSNKPDNVVHFVTDNIFGENYFDAVHGVIDGMPTKPNPFTALEITKKLGVKPSECLFLGDTNVDIFTAKNAEMTSVGVLWGFRTRNELVYKFVDFLKSAKQKCWQILPIGPTSYGDSPYQSFSTNAGNPYFIDMDILSEEGLLKKSDYSKLDWGKDRKNVDYETIYENRFKVLKIAFEEFKKGDLSEFYDFLQKNERWISNYALFMSIKNENDGKSWLEWEDGLRKRDSHSLWEFKSSHEDDVMFWEFVQFKFFEQWNKLKKYANDNGVSIIGDIPIYVALDSAEVWVYPDLFELDENLVPKAVAGCPPDAFSPTGQLWGNPLYNWDRHREYGFNWWIDRIKSATSLYDVVRIDHFRGFEGYYSIPYGDKTAENGQWLKGPGIELFNAVKNELGDLPIIAEDLGFLTEDVHKLLRDSGFPGMKVLEFAFDPREESNYLPYTYNSNSVVYVGTHDNNTVLGWIDELDEDTLEFCKKYIDSEDDIVWKLIKTAMASVSDTAIIQMQDYLELGSEARMNTPSVLGGNWQWRMGKNDLTDKLAKKIADITCTYGRYERQ